MDGVEGRCGTGLLGWKCLWDIQGTRSEKIVLEEPVSVNGTDLN